MIINYFRIGHGVNSGSLWNGLTGTYPDYKWQPYCTCEKDGTDLKPNSTCKFDESVRNIFNFTDHTCVLY